MSNSPGCIMEAKWSKNATSVVVLRHLYKTQIKWLIIIIYLSIYLTFFNLPRPTAATATTTATA